MRTRTWPYGTRKVVDVLSIEAVRSSRAQVVACGEPGVGGEGFILLLKDLAGVPPVGSRGTIVFREGGPTGGYWDFAADEPGREG